MLCFGLNTKSMVVKLRLREGPGLHQKVEGRASLVVQQLGICLSMQGTQVRSQVQEDPTC